MDVMHQCTVDLLGRELGAWTAIASGVASQRFRMIGGVGLKPKVGDQEKEGRAGGTGGNPVYGSRECTRGTDEKPIRGDTKLSHCGRQG
jgi:hypothetical protein